MPSLLRTRAPVEPRGEPAAALPPAADGRQRLLRAVGNVAAIVIGPLFLVWLTVISIGQDQYLVDFSHTFLPAARAAAAGSSPYPSAAHLHTLVATGKPVEAYVYPPLVALAMAPLTLVPHAVATVLYTAALLAALGAALWLLGVRDVRCATLVCLWPSTYTSLQTGAISIFVTLAIAVAWRWRGHALRAGAVVGLAVAAKLFLWPIGVWLLVTRRIRAAAAAAVTAAAAIVLGWAVIGFADVRAYPHLLSILNAHEAAIGFGPGGVAAALGVPQAVVTGFAAGLLAGAGVWVWRRPAAERDRAALTLAVFAALALSPIVWMHYFTLLLVPIALYRPRLSWLWAAPAAIELATIVPMSGVYPNGNLLALAVCWAGMAAIAVRVLRVDSGA